jgi:YegS/Rv2252/BmrU family lipid kinase
MMNDRVLIFANPIAGRGKGRVIAGRLERAMTAAGFSVQTFFERPADVAPTILNNPISAAIAIGGDGTLRSVVNLFFNHSRDGPPILPVPMGTANLMGQHLGIHWPNRGMTDAVIATLRGQKIVRLDAGRANGKLFLLMAGVGIDAQIVHLLDRVRRGPINMASYLLPAAMTFASFNFPPITVSVDDQTLLQNTPAIVMIGNVREYGIGIPILPDAVPDDGLLDVCIMPCRDRRELIEILVHIAAGEHITRDDVVYTRGKTARVESTESVAIQVDGDSAGFTPLIVEVLPAHVPFLIPNF